MPGDIGLVFLEMVDHLGRHLEYDDAFGEEPLDGGVGRLKGDGQDVLAFRAKGALPGQIESVGLDDSVPTWLRIAATDLGLPEFDPLASMSERDRDEFKKFDLEKAGHGDGIAGRVHRADEDFQAVGEDRKSVV